MAKQEYPLSLVIRAVDRATAPLREINARMKQMTAPVRKLNNSIRALSAEAGFPRLATGIRGVGSALGRVGDAASKTGVRLGAMLTGATGLVYLFKREFIDTADMFERLEISLTAIEGSAEAAGRAMDFIKSRAIETPFEMAEVAKAFRIMRGFGMDPMSGSLDAIINQTAKLGLTGEDLTGVALQLGQAWSKGRLQAQDANILVERGVPVWGLLERAVARVNDGQKITVGQLREMSEEGKLGHKAIKLLIDQMAIESEGAAASFMTAWSGMTARLADNWAFFKKAVMDSGPMDALKSRLEGILSTIERMEASGELAELAETVGARFVAGFEAAERILPDVWEALKDIGAAVAWLADLFGGWGNLLKVGVGAYIGGPLIVALASLGASLVTLAGAMGPIIARIAFWLGPNFGLLGKVVLPFLGKALMAVGAAFAKVGIAIMATPVGWILAAVAAIAGAAYLIYRYWEPISEFFVELWDMIKLAFQDFVDFFDELWGEFVGMLQEGWEKISPFVDRTPLGMLVNHLFAADEGEDTGAEGLGSSLGADEVGANMSMASETKIAVSFDNLPRGARVSRETKGDVSPDLSLGYSMVTP